MERIKYGDALCTRFGASPDPPRVQHTSTRVILVGLTKWVVEVEGELCGWCKGDGKA